MKHKSKFAICLCMTSLAAGMLATNAIAQETDAQADDIEEIVVTGSRIRRTNAESSMPLQVFGGQQLAEIGLTDLAEALTELPGISEGSSQANSNNSIQSAGLTTIDLRRLSDSRTLVLINGRRGVSNSGNADRISIDTLPDGFVERTEITTGGASAIYGSDAIAGVANFLLEDDFEGFFTDARYSALDASGGNEFRLNMRYGTRFADDRGYVLFSGSLRNEAMVRADATRPESILPIEFDDPIPADSGDAFTNEITRPGCDITNEDRHCLVPSFSGSTPGGVFEGDAWFRDGQWFNDESLNPDDPGRDGRDFVSDFDGYNFRPGRALLGSRDIKNVGIHSTFDFTSTIQATATLLYSDVTSRTRTGYETLNDDDEFGIVDGVPDVFEVDNIASDHPFIPPEVEETRSGSVSFDRRLIELGEQGRESDRETVRFMTSVYGDLDNGFAWEAFATYGRFSQDQFNPGEVNFLNAQRALDIEDDGNGGFQCVDAAARANGCVPLNIFGEGTITQAAADYIRYEGFASQSRTQITTGGSITGDLFQLKSGAVQFAAGLEFRHEEQTTNGDPDGDLVGGVDGDPATNDVFITSLATFPSVFAQYDVIEAFGELDIPIIADRLNANLAARIGNYDSIGSVFSYNMGSTFRPVEGFTVRAQYSRSQRAPNISELFSPPRPDSDDLIDPCEDLFQDGTFDDKDRLAGNGGQNADLTIVSANCLNDPAIQAYFADPDNIDDATGLPEAFNPPGSTQGPNSGNIDLQEETADTITFGFVFQPTRVPGLTAIVDYYKIEIEDAIDSISTQDTVDLCYSDADFPNSKFCDVITRNSNNGEVVQVINFQENLNDQLIEGIDFSLEYDFDPSFVPGDFDVDFRYSHYINEETRFTGIGGVELVDSSLAEIELPDDEYRFSIRYSQGGLRVRYTATFEQGGVDDLNNAPDPSFDRFFEVDDEIYHRIYAGYDFGEDDRYRLYGGINNIENNLGPLIPTGTFSGGSRNLSSDINRAAGREYYAGVRFVF